MPFSVLCSQFSTVATCSQLFIVSPVSVFCVTVIIPPVREVKAGYTNSYITRGLTKDTPVSVVQFDIKGKVKVCV